MVVQELSFVDFAGRYCGRQQSTPDKLLRILREQKKKYQPVGWMLLECQVMDSSRMGSLTILPYGPNNSLKSPPAQPFSPRGLASDTSVVIALLPAENLPDA